MKPNEIIDSCMITIGSLYSLTNLQEILGVIILIMQIIWIGIKITIKVKNKIHKTAELEVLEEDVHCLIDSVKELKETLEHKEDNNG